MKTALLNTALVGSGGFFGALLRYGFSGLVHRQISLTTFPYGTLVVNLVGCFLIGVFAGLADARQLFGPQIRIFVLVGLLGGFTTFSTFGYETVVLLRDHGNLRALANVGMHVVVGLALVWIGYGLTSSR